MFEGGTYDINMYQVVLPTPYFSLDSLTSDTIYDVTTDEYWMPEQ